MADASDTTQSLTLQQIESETQLVSFLRARNALGSWADLRQHFFTPLLKIVEAGDQQWILDAQFVRVGEVLQELLHFVVSENFQHYLNEWRAAPESLDWPQLSAKIQDIFEVQQFLEIDHNEGLSYNPNRKFELKQRIESLVALLSAIFLPEEASIDPDEKQKVEAALQLIFGKLQQKTGSIKDLLDSSPDDLKLTDKTTQALANHLKTLGEMAAKAVEDEVQQLEVTYRKELQEKLTEYRRETLKNSENETKNEVENIEQSRQIQGTIGKAGLVVASLVYVENQQVREYQDRLVDFILRRVVVTSVRGPEQDTISTVDLLLEALEKLLEYLEKRRTKFVEEADKKFDEAVQKLLGIGNTAPTDTGPDGGDSLPDDTPTATPGEGLQTLVQTWSAAALAWRESLAFLLFFTDDQQKEIGEILSRNALRTETLEATNTPWDSIFVNYGPEKQQQSQADAERLLQLLDELERPKAEALEDPPKQEVTSAVPLITPIDQKDVPDEEKAANSRFEQIGRISRDKATVDSIVEARLRQILKENGLPQDQIEDQLNLYKSTLSSEMWLALLQAGILENKLAFQQIIELQTQFVEKYSQIILKQQTIIGANSIRSKIEEFYAANPTIDIQELEKQFQPERIKEVFAYARELKDPTKRWQAVLRFCQSEFNYTPSEQYKIFFYRLTEGVTIAETATLLDDLTLNLYQKTWSQTTDAQKETVRANLALFYDHIFIFGAIFGLPDLIQAQGMLKQVQLYTQQVDTFLAQLQAQGQTKAVTFYSSLKSFTGEDETEQAEIAPQVSAASQAIEISTTLFIIQTLEISVEQRKIVEALAIDRQLRGEAFGPAELGYVMAAFRDEPNGFIDPAMQARLDPDLQKWRELQQNNPDDFNQQHSGLHASAASQQNQGQGVNAQRQKLQTAMAIAKAAAGGPAAWALLLKDPNVQKALIKLAQDPRVIAGLIAIPAVPAFVLSRILSDPIGAIGSLLSPGGSTVASVGLPAGLSGELAEGASIAQTGLNNSAAAALKNFTTGAAEMAKAIPSSISSGITNLGLGKTFAVLAGVSFLGPIGLAGILTIIVITVIGASLNDLPFGYIRSSFYDGVVCWPTNGTITQLDEPGHETSDNGSAVDIGARLGEPIYTPFSGTVARAPREMAKDGYGYYVDIKTDDGFNVIFAHMGDPSPLSQGARVEANTQVGSVGNSGNSDGAHLHYEIISTTLKITDIVPSQPPFVKGSVVSVDQCENFGTDAKGGLVAITAGGGGYAYIFNDGYNIVTQADLSATKHVGVFGQSNQLEAAINGNLYTPAAGTIDGIYTNGAGNAGYSLDPRPMEIAALFLSVDSLPASTVSQLAVPSGNRVLYNQNGLVMLNIRGVGSSAGDEQVIREEILPLVEHAVSGVPPIMINGTAQDMTPYSVSDPVSTTVLRPRTVFGWRDSTAGREFAFIVVRDATFWDLDEVANEVGLSYAFALDGGNSSQLYVQDHDFSGDGGWIDAGGGWHPEGGNRAVPVLIGIEPKNENK